MLSSIYKVCGNDKKKLIKILEDIKRINIKPTDTNGKHVYCIEDGKITVIPTIDFKSVHCLCQSIKGNDALRIVWGMQDNRLKALEVFPDHIKTNAAYVNYIRSVDGANITDDCMTVEKAIKIIEDDGPGGPGGGLSETEEKNKRSAKTDVTESDEQSEAPSTKNVSKDEPSLSQTKQINWKDLNSVSYNLEQQIESLKKEEHFYSAMLFIGNQSIKEKQDVLRRLNTILNKTKKCEEILSKIQRIKGTIQAIKQNFEKMR